MVNSTASTATMSQCARASQLCQQYMKDGACFEPQHFDLDTSQDNLDMWCGISESYDTMTYRDPPIIQSMCAFPERVFQLKDHPWQSQFPAVFHHMYERLVTSAPWRLFARLFTSPRTPYECVTLLGRVFKEHGISVQKLDNGDYLDTRALNPSPRDLQIRTDLFVETFDPNRQISGPIVAALYHFCIRRMSMLFFALDRYWNAHMFAAGPFTVGRDNLCHKYTRHFLRTQFLPADVAGAVCQLPWFVDIFAAEVARPILGLPLEFAVRRYLLNMPTWLDKTASVHTTLPAMHNLVMVYHAYMASADSPEEKLARQQMLRPVLDAWERKQFTAPNEDMAQRMYKYLMHLWTEYTYDPRHTCLETDCVECRLYKMLLEAIDHYSPLHFYTLFVLYHAFESRVLVNTLGRLVPLFPTLFQKSEFNIAKWLVNHTSATRGRGNRDMWLPLLHSAAVQNMPAYAHAIQKREQRLSQMKTP